MTDECWDDIGVSASQIGNLNINTPAQPARPLSFGRGRGIIRTAQNGDAQSNGRGRGTFSFGSANANVASNNAVGFSSVAPATSGGMHFGQNATGFATSFGPASQQNGFGGGRPSTGFGSSFGGGGLLPAVSASTYTGSRGGFDAPNAGVYNPPKLLSTEPQWNVQLPPDPREENELFESAHISSGINFKLYDKIQVKAEGINVPAAVNSFSELRVHPFLMDNVKLCKYDTPTPIQKHAVVFGLAGRDVMGCAQTGSGKTAAYLLPILNFILTKGSQYFQTPEYKPGCRDPCELSLQIYNEAMKFAYRTCIKPCMLYGGRENYGEQLRALSRGCHVLIGTPGRINDVLERGLLSLKHTKFFVLDEADRMLDMVIHGFVPQIRQIVRFELPEKENRQTLMFSATFPGEIKRLAQEFLVSNYIYLTVGRVGSTSENITQQIIQMEPYERDDHLIASINSLGQLGDKNLCLIFVETKRNADELSRKLTNYGKPAVAIHGDLAQFERERHLKLFKAGEKPILVATSVAARGLDIPNVNMVVNYEFPREFEEYVHRIGRTGRAGNKDYAINQSTEVCFRMLDFVLERNYGGRSSFGGGGSSGFGSSGFSHSNSSPAMAAPSGPSHGLWVPRSRPPADSAGAGGGGFGYSAAAAASNPSAMPGRGNVTASREENRVDWWD